MSREGDAVLTKLWSKMIGGSRVPEAPPSAGGRLFDPLPYSPLHVVDWSTYETAYGSAMAIPGLLGQLAGNDHATAMAASHELWCSLCHQHAYVSNAALPALPYLFAAFNAAGEELKIEILDIFAGFAICTSTTARNTDWMNELRFQLRLQAPIFQRLAVSSNEEIASFCEQIVEALGLSTLLAR